MYLCNRLQTAGKLKLVDTMVHRLAIGSTFRHWSLTASTAHTDSVDHITCLNQNKTLKVGLEVTRTMTDFKHKFTIYLFLSALSLF